MPYLFVVSLLLLSSFTYCEEKLIFAYSYSMAGTGYPKHKILPWTLNTSLSITPAGARQHYILGRELRNRLILNHNLLDHHHNPPQLIVHPIMVDRAVESAYAQAAGLYHVGTGENITNEKARKGAMPPNKFDFEPWIKSLGLSALNHTYQVVPLLLNGEASDTFFDPENSCPLLKDFIIKRTTNWKTLFDKELTKLVLKLNIPKDSVNNIIHLSELRELILDGIVEGHYIDNFDSDLSLYIDIGKTIEPYIDYTNFLDVGTTSKLLSTPILTDIKMKFEEVHNKAVNKKIKRDDLKYVSLIGLNHRVLLALLKQLSITPKETPMPASILLLELYEIESGSGSARFEVRYTYDNQAGYFTFNDFINKIKGSILSEPDFKKQCGI